MLKYNKLLVNHFMMRLQKKKRVSVVYYYAQLVIFVCMCVLNPYDYNYDFVIDIVSKHFQFEMSASLPL